MKSINVQTDGNTQKYLHLSQLAGEFNAQREELLEIANSEPGNEMARQHKWEAIGALRLLDRLADHLYLVRVTTYVVK